MKEIVKKMFTIEVIDDEETSKKDNRNTQRDHVMRGSPNNTMNTLSSNTTYHDTPLDEMKTPSTSPSIEHVTESVTRDLRSDVTDVAERDTSCDSVTDNFPTILSNRQIYENIDNIPRPSYWLPETEPDEEKKEEEIDDFEYLGMLDDGYLLSLFAEEEEQDDSVPDLTEEVTQCQVPPHSDITETGSEQEPDNTPLDRVTATDEVSERRSNPPRLAKQGVSYCEDSGELEEILQSEYCKFGLTR